MHYYEFKKSLKEVSGGAILQAGLVGSHLSLANPPKQTTSGAMPMKPQSFGKKQKPV
jgi:hypothetical protein